MVRSRGEQRNRYDGIPPRPWASVRLVQPDGAQSQRRLLADTGNPLPLIVGMEDMQRFCVDNAPNLDTNFGVLLGGWVRVVIPELAIDHRILAYGSDDVLRASRQSSRDFDGLIGLPLLRMTEYGGDQEFFWLREPNR